MVLTDIDEVKEILEILPENKVEDVKLNFFIETASDWIIEYLGRRDELDFKSRTEYYNGTGTQTIQLRARPVYLTPALQVFEDRGGYFGSTSGAFDATLSVLQFGIDYCLDVKEDGRPSRSGLLIRIGEFWPRPMIRRRGYLSPYVGQSFGNVKVIYTAGYTTESLPRQIREAANLLVTRMRYLYPLGMELSSDSFQQRNIGMVVQRKGYLMALVKPMLVQFRNWRF